MGCGWAWRGGWGWAGSDGAGAGAGGLGLGLGRWGCWDENRESHGSLLGCTPGSLTVVCGVGHSRR